MIGKVETPVRAGWRLAALGLAAFVLVVALVGGVWYSASLSSAGSGDIIVDSVGDGADPTPNDGDCDDGGGNCTLRAAIETANANLGPDSIAFDIAGDGPHTISPGSPLPESTGPLLIDGLTQEGATPNALENKEGTNALLKIEIDGSGAGPDADGIVLKGGDSIVRGLVINRFGGSGVRIDGNDMNKVEGSFIGTDSGGTLALGNGQGVLITASVGNIIGASFGSPSAAPANLISGNGIGVIMTDGAMANFIRGNIIGTTRDGETPLPNDSHGVLLSNGALCNTIGSEEEDGENIIAFNGGHAVSMTDAVGVNNYVDPNEMHSNEGMGIDLGDDGVTPNDVDDLDSGPNDLQNFPIITSAVTFNPPGSIVIKATLDSIPNTFMNVFFFSNIECDPSGHGEGRRFLGKVLFKTGPDGDAEINAPLQAEVQPGAVITSTVSSPESTSEFSPCFVATDSGTVRLQGDVDCDTDVDSVDGLAQLRHVGGLGVNQQPGCPAVGSDFAAVFGDVDCDGDVDTVDALKVLRHLVGFSVTQVEPCADIATPL